MAIKKLFIAGARCPQCSAEDRIRLCREGQREWLECVACGYESAEPPAPEHPNVVEDHNKSLANGIATDRQVEQDAGVIKWTALRKE